MATQQSAPHSAPESTQDDADADADADDADADDDAPASPARVMVPYSSSGGPQIPPELEGTLGAVGEPASKKKRLQRAHGGKQGDKGLRHFSMKVCEKVEQKGRTTYNEVADELVAEFGACLPARARALPELPSSPSPSARFQLRSRHRRWSRPSTKRTTRRTSEGQPPPSSTHSPTPASTPRPDLAA